jgi:hypothetical protein
MPPTRPSETRIHADLVVIVEINPAPQSVNGLSPLGRISHDDGTALRVVLVNGHVQYILLALDAERFVDLVLNGKTMGVPAKATRNMVSLHVPVPRDDVLNGASQEMAIVGKSSGTGQHGIRHGEAQTSGHSHPVQNGGPS